MIAGLLLLYIGMKFGFPLLYFVGVWFVIGINFLKHFSNFMKGVYDAGREDGKE